MSPSDRDPPEAAPRRAVPGRHLWTGIAEELTNRIANGELAPGQHLSEPALAREFGVSRLPVREAIRALHRSGLLDVHPHQGARVRVLEPDQVRHLLALCALVDGYAAQQAALHRTDDDLAAMGAILRAGMRASADGDQPAAIEAHDQLMAAIEHASGNPYLAELAASLSHRIRPLLTSLLPQRRLEPWAEHAAIVDAIAAGNATDAQRLMNLHLNAIADLLGVDSTAAPASQPPLR